MKKYKFIIYIVLGLLIINTKPINYIFSFFLDQGLYSYSNSSGTFIRTELKSYDFEGVKTNFKIFNLENSGEQNTILYRQFNRNPIFFWRWGNYVFDERYQLLYKDPLGRN